MNTQSNDDARTSAGRLQDEVRGLSETVQRQASENETLRNQWTVGAVRTVTMRTKLQG